MRLRRNAKIEFIRKVPLFARCTKRKLEAIAAEATELAVAIGKTLTTQGERGREFVVIADGTADVTRGGDLIAQLRPSDFVGEIALISDEPRTATSDNDFTGVILVLSAGVRATRQEHAVGAGEGDEGASRRLHQTAF